MWKSKKKKKKRESTDRMNIIASKANFCRFNIFHSQRFTLNCLLRCYTVDVLSRAPSAGSNMLNMFHRNWTEHMLSVCLFEINLYKSTQKPKPLRNDIKDIEQGCKGKQRNRRPSCKLWIRERRRKKQKIEFVPSVQISTLSNWCNVMYLERRKSSWEW